MTQLEFTFLSTVPVYLKQLVEELKKLNETLNNKQK